MKDLSYYKKNAEKYYSKTPKNVLRYISELEKNTASNRPKSRENGDILRGCFIALDKASGDSLSTPFLIKTTEDATAQFKEFEESVPFARWYCDIETDNIVLSDKQKELLESINVIIND